MERVQYGRTPLMVSRLCWGTGLMGRLKHNMSPDEAARILWRGYELGVNFWDTADGYGTHPHVGAALRPLPRQEIVINTKTPARTFEQASQDVRRYLQELGTEYIDSILLHGIETVDELENRRGAMEALWRAKEAGLVRAVGISTHLGTGAIMEACATRPEIEVVLTTVNKDGLMLKGDMAAHLKLVEQVYRAGKGVCLMKTLAQGRYVSSPRECIQYNLSLPFAHSVCVGVNSIEEVEFAVDVAHPVPV